MEAKLKLANDDCEGSGICHEYLDRLKIIRLLLSNSCPFIPSIDELKMPAVRRCIYCPCHYHHYHSVLTSVAVILIPHLHDTAGCQTGLTTVLNEQPLFVQPVVKLGCTTGLTTVMNEQTVRSTRLTTG